MDGRGLCNRLLARTMRISAGTLLTLTAAALLSAGCGSNKLETGYTYSPLDSSATQRRAYYAGPFSPEARAAMRDPSNSEATVGPDAHRRAGM